MFWSARKTRAEDQGAPTVAVATSCPQFFRVHLVADISQISRDIVSESPIHSAFDYIHDFAVAF
jgi:hypothetical protein